MGPLQEPCSEKLHRMKGAQVQTLLMWDDESFAEGEILIQECDMGQ